MERLLDAELKAAFPQDVGESMMIDVLRMCKGDKAQAMEYAKGIGQQGEEEKKKERDRKIAELQGNFRDITPDIISKCLSENDWNVDRAILPLFEYSQRQREEERSSEEKLQAKRTEQRDSEKKSAKQFLKIAFKNIPEAQIQNLLDANEGDVDATTQQLLAMVFAEQQQEEKKRQIQFERETRIDTLRKQFSENISEEEVVEVLERNAWDVQKATEKLLKMSEKRKKEHLQRLFKLMPMKEIEKALIENHWNTSKAIKSLTLLKYANNLRKSEEMEAKKREQEIQETHDEPEEEEAEEEEAGEKEEGFLKRSMMLGKELDEIVQQQVKKQDTSEKIIKSELERLIRFGPNDLPGVPGAALSRKMIDKMHSKKAVPPPVSVVLPAPVDDESLIDQEIQEVTESMRQLEAAESAERVKVTLAETRVEVGGKIELSWEFVDDSSVPTTSDWIGLYNLGKKEKEYVTYEWVKISDAGGKGKKANGKAVFYAPKLFGRYEFRYYEKRGYSRVLGRSEPIAVGPDVRLSVEKLGEGLNQVRVQFEQRTGKVYPNAWIGLYEKNQSESGSYLTYDWISNSVDNALKFSVPRRGEYEVRYYPEKSYVDVSRCAFVVGGDDSVELKDEKEADVLAVKFVVASADPTTDYVWVGLFHKEETDNRQWRRYKYVSEREGVAKFKRPRTPGIYQARMFANKSYEALCVSSQEVVIPTITQ